jgi:hypothetical protein
MFKTKIPQFCESRTRASETDWSLEPVTYDFLGTISVTGRTLKSFHVCFETDLKLHSRQPFSGLNTSSDMAERHNCGLPRWT